MPTPARGSWELHEAIVFRWTELAGLHPDLDAAFRAYWTNPAATSPPVLNKGEARPQTPTPYCVFKVSDPTVDGHSTGKTEDTAQQYVRVVVEFKIFAKSTPTRSGEMICVDLAKLVAAKYDPPYKPVMTNDKHIATIRESDGSERVDDNEWAWKLTYVFTIDATYNAATRTGV